jgi:hypothetical protein
MRTKKSMSMKKKKSSKKSKSVKKSLKQNLNPNSNSNPIAIPSENYSIKYRKIKQNISRKDVRKYEVDRVSNIISLIPKFTKFYNKLSTKEIMALKYYKGYGSFWQTQFLTNEKSPREVTFPFNIWSEQAFRNDIYGEGKNVYPMLKSFDIKDIPNYIENNYKARIMLLNTLDTIYNNPECPRFTGEEILFRGMGAPPSLLKCKAGDSFLFKNFMSSTFDRNEAERFAWGDILLIFSDMKDIPFIYMPNDKPILSSGIEYTKNLKNLSILNDYSECTLPRNLEFKINRIEEGIVSPNIAKMMSWSMNTMRNKGKKGKKGKTIRTYNKLENILKRKGLIDSKEEKTEDKNKLIEDKIFPKIKIYYCSLLKWQPREELIYENLMKDVKYVLDKDALESWSGKNDDYW